MVTDGKMNGNRVTAYRQVDGTRRGHHQAEG